MRNHRVIGIQVLIVASLLASAGCVTAQSGAPEVEPAAPYSAGCAQADELCHAWEQFRTNRPFPYQSIQGKRLSDGTVAIILSEPPPILPKSELDHLIKTEFGTDLISLRHRRWRMGADGWLEDTILNVNTGVRSGDPLSDSLFRDRVAFLYLAFFGTTYGSDFQFQEGMGPAKGPAATPNLEVTAHEVRQWLTAEPLQWRRLDSNQFEPFTWAKLSAGTAAGAFHNDDNTLILFTFPAQLLRAALTDRSVLAPLRLPFRRFAVASDAIVGAFVSPGGSVAILGRPRTHSFSMVPPLRFETFQMLASQSADELSQSYERMSLFSGKLLSGQYKFHDWAPIYLSDALIDTEFGALLNTTDQLLKSWSQAGDVEYLYFNYPKPDQYPFGKLPLSDVVMRQTGSTSVLFNWNTAGSTVLVDTSAGKIITTKRTGALPVTYGSETAAHNGPQAGKLMVQEEAAYQYFAHRQDANLERVVEYTFLYQLCKSVTGSQANGQPGPGHELQTTAVKASRAAAEVRVKAAIDLLDNLQSDRLEISAATEADLQKKLKAVRDRYPSLNTQQLASILSDRFSADSKRMEASRDLRLTTFSKQLQEKLGQFNRDVNAFNSTLGKSRLGAADNTENRRQQLDERRQELRREEAYLNEAENEDVFQGLRIALYRVAMRATNTDRVRLQFMAAQRYDPEGAIKTPSIVLSWDTHEIESVGGHNIDSRALKLQPNPNVSGIALKETDKGIVLEFNPSKASLVESHASELARAVEHGHIKDVSELSKIMADAPRPIRPRNIALDLPKAPAAVEDVWSARLGSRVYDKKAAFVDDLRTMAEKNDCCIFVVHDEREVAFATEQNLKPPPVALMYEIRDTPSMNSYLRESAARAGKQGDRAVIFFDTPESHIRALGINAEKPAEANLTEMAEMLGARDAVARELRSDGISQRDLNGNDSVLRSLVKVTEARVRNLFARLTYRQPANSWTRATVTHVDGAQAQHFVADLDWESARDGIPSAILLKFEGGTGKQPPLDVQVVAGFSDENSSAGQAQLRASHEKSMAAATAKAASIAQYAMTVRNELLRMPDIKLRRLAVLVQEGNTRTLLSWNGKPSEQGGYER